jgi:DNA-binding FadR family transcriptional regulator
MWTDTDEISLARQIQRDSLPEQVAQAIQRLILTGEIPVGTSLPSAAKLMKIFRCSRTVIREALADVVQQGMVTREGPLLVVQPISLDKVSHTARIYMALEQVTVRELFESLEVVDATSARLAAERRDPEGIAELQKLNAPGHTTVENIPQIEAKFHMGLAEASKNRLLVAAWKPILDASLVTSANLGATMGKRAVTGIERAHTEILKAIMDGNGDLAESWSRRHITAWRDNLVEGHHMSLDDAVRPFQ